MIRKMIRFALIVFGLIILFMLFSVFFLPGLYDFLGFKDDSVSTAGDKFYTKVLSKRDLRTYRELDGILEYDNNTEIRSNGSGVVTYLAGEGSSLDRGSVLFRVFKSKDSADILSWKQQLASTRASVSQAELSLENLNKLATPSQIASAKASVSQAELALENLNKPAMASQIASADASVAQAELALENLNKPATASQIASADASVAQAEANAITAKGRIEVRHSSRKNTRILFCDQANVIGFREWIYEASICPADDSLLANEAITTLFSNLFIEPTLVSTGTALLTNHHDYNSAVASYESAIKTVEQSKKNLNALGETPSALAVQQSEKSLKFAKEQRAQLNELPSDTAINQAEHSLQAAKEYRSDLDDKPSASAIKQTEDSLESAKEYLSQLSQSPSNSELLQANASLDSAKTSLESAIAAGEELIVGSSGVVLMFGKNPARRGFKFGMDNGLDVQQLEENLILMGYGNQLAFGADTHFDHDTRDSIKLMQEGLEMNTTGNLPFGTIVFLPGPILVESLSASVNLGISVPKGQTIMSVVVIERPDKSLAFNPNVASNRQSSQRVITTIDVQDRHIISLETEVEIELPDGTTTIGWIESIGSIAVIPDGPQASDPYFDLDIRLREDGGFHQWTGAEVTVLVTKELALETLSVEVTALLALLDGGYAIEVVRGSDAVLIPVELGIYSDGWVEIRGEGLQEGLEVLIPE